MTMTPSNPMSLEQVRDDLRKHASCFRTAPSLPTTANALDRLADAIDAELKRRESEAVAPLARGQVSKNGDIGHIAFWLPAEWVCRTVHLYAADTSPPSQPSAGVPTDLMVKCAQDTHKGISGKTISFDLMRECLIAGMAAAPRSP